jgi:hypothetical protein
MFSFNFCLLFLATCKLILHSLSLWWSHLATGLRSTVSEHLERNRQALQIADDQCSNRYQCISVVFAYLVNYPSTACQHIAHFSQAADWCHVAVT